MRFHPVSWKLTNKKTTNIMWYLPLLILLGLLFLFVELLLLPGVSVGALLALICYGSAIYLAFTHFGMTVGLIIIAIILLLSLVAVIYSLRAKTWQRLSLKEQVTSSSMPSPAEVLQPGMQGVAISRLAPMGKVNINGALYEAKSTDVYIDARSTVEVVGFENFNVIVKKVE